MARSARISQLGLIDGRNGTFGISRLESTSDLPDDTHGAWPAATKATDSAPQEQFRPTAVITSAVTAGGMATLQANMEEPAERVLPGRCRGPVMAGLVVAISFVLFVGGFLLGALLVVSVGIRAEDKAAMRRRDGSILLHEEPVSQLSRGVRRLTGAGQRGVPSPGAGYSRREDR